MRYEHRYEQRRNYDNKVSVPHTTDATVVFPYTNGIFERNYNPSYTDGRVSFEQVNEALNHVEVVLREHLGIVNVLGCFLILMVVSAIIALVSYRDAARQPGLIVGGFFSIFFFAVLVGIVRTRKINQARIVLQQFLDMQNGRLASLGVRWSLPHHFPMWIELNNDFKSVPGYQANVLIPPVIVVPQVQVSPFPQTQIQFQQPQMQVQVQQNGFMNYNQPQNNYYPPQQYNQI